MMHAYRTTFTASPTVANAIRERARGEGKSISSVVNEMLLFALDGKTAQPKASEPFKVVPRAMGLKLGDDPARIKEFIDELELERL